MNNCHTCSMLIAVLFVLALTPADPQPAATEDIKVMSAERIAALNEVVLRHKASAAPGLAQVELPGGEKKTVLKIREELATHGVSIQMVNGKYVDVSTKVANGHVLDPQDKKRIAFLNYCHQAFVTGRDVRYKAPGSVIALMDTFKEQLEERGITLKLEGDLFIVDSVRKTP